MENKDNAEVSRDDHVVVFKMTSQLSPLHSSKSTPTATVNAILPELINADAMHGALIVDGILGDAN